MPAGPVVALDENICCRYARRAWEHDVGSCDARFDEHGNMLEESPLCYQNESERTTITHVMMVVRRAVVTISCSFLRTGLLREAVGLQALSLNRSR